MLNLKKIFGNIILCFAVLFCAVLVSQESRPIVAVLEPVGNSSITPMHRMLARGELENKILASEKYKVVDRSRTDQVFKEHDFARGDAVDSSKAKEIGKILQADIVCASELRKEDGYFVAICSLIDVESGEVFASATEIIEADNPVEIKKSLGLAAMTIVGVRNPRLEQAVQAAVRSYEDTDAARRQMQAEMEVEQEALERFRTALNSTVPTEDEVRSAKMAINRLMKFFTLEKGTYKNRILDNYEKTQNASHKHLNISFGWHALLAEIVNGKLMGESLWVYHVKDPTGNKYILNHNTISVTIDGKVTSSHVEMKHTKGTKVAGAAKTALKAAKFLGTLGHVNEIAASTKESATIDDEEFLRTIAFAGNKRIDVVLMGGNSTSFVLNPGIQVSIARTVALYDAMQVLKRANEPIQPHYSM